MVFAGGGRFGVEEVSPLWFIPRSPRAVGRPVLKRSGPHDFGAPWRCRVVRPPRPGPGGTRTVQMFSSLPLVKGSVAGMREGDQMGFEVRHVAGALGAELTGVDLTSMDEVDIGELRALIHEHEVVFFREVWLTEEQHLTLGRALGRPSIFPISRLLGGTEPSFQRISDGPESPSEADSWHTDVTWVAEPPKYALLCAEVMPDRGGDTMWASMTAAYDALSPTMQRVVSGLRVVHDNECFVAALLRKTGRTWEPKRSPSGFEASTRPLCILSCAPIQTRVDGPCSSGANSCATSRACTTTRAEPCSSSLHATSTHPAFIAGGDGRRETWRSGMNDPRIIETPERRCTKNE